jgi:hypothetical protein
VRLARAFVVQGRPRRARDVLERAMAVAGDLGIATGAEVIDLLAEIDRTV